MKRNDTYKRSFDLIILVVSHILLGPIFLVLWILIPLAIWCDDRGPIFFRQARTGKNGAVFLLFKFRSMVPDAELSTGAIWAEKDDPRITKVGRFLRRRALDELPQVINMWKGDLSIVGPRPERPELVEGIVNVIPQFTKRNEITPGLTGLAQVYGQYTTAPRNKLRYDTLYIKRMSPCLDTKLIFRSIVYTLRGSWQTQRNPKQNRS